MDALTQAVRSTRPQIGVSARPKDEANAGQLTGMAGSALSVRCSAEGTGTGLTIRSDLDDNCYPLGVKVTDDQMETLTIRRNSFHGEWNYTLSPRT